MLKYGPQSGLAAIIAVVVISAVALLVAKSVSLEGISQIEAAYAFSRGQAAYVVADGCVEEALRRLQINPDYTANNSIINIGSGVCTLEVSANGEQKFIKALGRFQDYYKKIIAQATINDGQITIDSWQEASW